MLKSEDIPVLLTIFNRPDKTRAVMERLRQIRPKRLFVAADGPRPERPEDGDRCRQARQAATTAGWTCDIKARFLDDNIGVDPAVSSAIEWFFGQVEYGIILEDDGLPHPHFFNFCGDLLVRYHDDERIMQISALSPYAAREHLYDYHFSRMFRCSGAWATWRRAWKHYTSDLRQYIDEEALGIIKSYFTDYTKCMQLYGNLLDFKKGRLNHWTAWDFQWNLACYAQNGLSIVPERNLMINIGFDEESTHTQAVNPIFEDLQTRPLQFPLRHPQFVYADSRPERSLEKKLYRGLPVKSRCMYRLRRALGAIAYLRDVMP